MLHSLHRIRDHYYNELHMHNALPNKLRELRLKAGLRQIDVARAIGLQSPDRISEWEKGLRYPNVGNLFKLARFFSVTVDSLYADENE